MPIDDKHQTLEELEREYRHRALIAINSVGQADHHEHVEERNWAWHDLQKAKAASRA